MLSPNCVLRAVGAGALLAFACFCAPAAAAATVQEPFPSRPLTWLVGYPAGGGSDFLARTVGDQIAEQLKEPVVVDNKPGAGGMLAAGAAAKAPADGYTLVTVDNGILIYNPVLYKSTPYNADKDFAPLGLVARVPLVLVTSPGTGITSVQGLIAAMKANPNKYSFASPGNGSPHHLAIELFKEKVEVSAGHVPYKGGGLAMVDVIAGKVPLMVVDSATGFANIRSGKLTPLMVFSAKRSPLFPDVPTARELGYRDIEAYAWQGLAVPAATPQRVRDRLSQEMQTAMSNHAVRKKLMDAGWEPNPSDPVLMSVYIMAEKAKWHKLIRERGIKLE
jgi:tripartite-type tricarboxylate transporter receptor subunit TctC